MATVTEKTAIPTGIWKSDPVHSHCRVRRQAHGRGHVPRHLHRLRRDPRKPGGEPGLYGAVRVDSVDVRDEKLTGHLLSPDFFDAERTPRSLHLDRHPDRGRRAGRRRRADDQGHDDGPSRPAARSSGRSRTSPASERRRNRSRDHGGPPRVRPELERSAAERRLRGRERGHARRPPGAREGGVVMRVLGISGSLRSGSHNTRLLRVAAQLVPPPARARDVRRAEGRPAIRRGRRHGSGAGGRAAPARCDRARPTPS